ncbi:hypothetical protein EVAR_92012_1 [Eumeta japonica]|uniref:Uncharacterized protein n=1 Tax=Eumeta variegata TaxID=151549 RepID=A0A4C1ZYL1_EUMVA|nr:hypothetical protein EVAR_92012_1 [Eumeta japonica]
MYGVAVVPHTRTMRPAIARRARLHGTFPERGPGTNSLPYMVKAPADVPRKLTQLQKLLSEVELGDQGRRLLRRMRDLVRTKIPDNTLRVMWTGHLPTAVRAVLAVSDTKDLDNLAAVADKIIENTATC